MQRHGLEEKWAIASVVGRELCRVKDRLIHRGVHLSKMNPHSNWLTKGKRLNFLTSGNQQGLKPGV